MVVVYLNRLTSTVQLLVAISFVLMKICECQECSGTSNGLSVPSGGNPAFYTKSYANCTVITKNVEIVLFRQNLDWSFLNTIEEVKGYILIRGTNFKNFTMKNLRLIRGIELFGDYSLNIVNNQDLKRIVFPSLREILNGKVNIQGNPRLCFIDSIQWNDVMKIDIVMVQRASSDCESCKESCLRKDKPSCWAEDVCQEMWRITCEQDCETGCLSDALGKCCHDECASGCKDKFDNCIDCRNFNNNGTCVNTCPGNSRGSTSPKRKFHFENNCVEKCPNSTVVTSDVNCVSHCPGGYYQHKDECAPCTDNSPCPKVCKTDDSISYKNIKTLVNCSSIHGHLEFLVSSFTKKKPPIYEFLENLSTITEITGGLIIQSTPENLTDLNFLRNLKVIKGHGTDKFQNIALQVLKTHLKTLNLPSLERIESRLLVHHNSDLEDFNLPSLNYIRGDDDNRLANVKYNSKLCYVTNETFEEISDSKKLIAVMENSPFSDCVEKNKVCHKQCSGSCWGPGNKLCRVCRHYRFEGGCIASCDEYPNLYANGNECMRCHPQCLGCNGEGPKHCIQCLNAINDFECIERCPVIKYQDPDSGQCLPCHPFCKDGCSGPSHMLGKGGCNNCHMLMLHTNECLDYNYKCQDTFYEKHEKRSVIDSDGHNVMGLVNICHKCDPLCKSCTDRGSDSETCECAIVEYNGACQESCPPQHYQDSTNKCHLCHSECDTCYGPTADMCFTCKNVRIYKVINKTNDDDDDLNEIIQDFWNNTVTKTPDYLDEKEEYSDESQDEFICISTCPADKPHSVEIQSNGTVQRKCQLFVAPDPSMVITRSSNVLIVTLVIGGILLFGVVVIVITVLRRQKAKSELNKAKLQAHIEGLNAEEILTPTNIKPDLSCLRLIKETELEKGEEVGSGAFGTVYKGIWHPENEKVKVAVAIKVLVEGSGSAQHMELLEEARVMASVSHPCCIRILAVCLARQMMLVTPLVVHGSLLDYIRKNGPTLGSHSLLKWATQIARGMAYLEQIGIVHRDLAARNILVQSLNQVKITDFGLAKLLNIDEHYLAAGGKLPIKWLALESIQHRIFTFKSDVWSYGVTLWELFTFGQRPYENVSALDMAEHLEMGERLPQPSICTIDVYMIMIKCWMVDSDSRPSFQELELDFGVMSKDPCRFLVIPGDNQLKTSINLYEDNRMELIRQLNLACDEDLLICGEDYLDPADEQFRFRDSLAPGNESTCFMNPEYLNNPDDNKLKYLEAALLRDKNSEEVQYLTSPGADQNKKALILDDKELIKLEDNTNKNFYVDQKHITKNKIEDDGYLEPLIKIDAASPSPHNYLDMKSPGVGLQDKSLNLLQPAISSKPAAARKGEEEKDIFKKNRKRGNEEKVAGILYEKQDR